MIKKFLEENLEEIKDDLTNYSYTNKIFYEIIKSLKDYPIIENNKADIEYLVKIGKVFKDKDKKDISSLFKFSETFSIINNNEIYPCGDDYLDKLILVKKHLNVLIIEEIHRTHLDDFKICFKELLKDENNKKNISNKLIEEKIQKNRLNINQYLLLFDLKIYKILGDGNCFFRCLENYVNEVNFIF